jgi:hypothetical protein
MKLTPEQQNKIEWILNINEHAVTVYGDTIVSISDCEDWRDEAELTPDTVIANCNPNMGLMNCSP